MRFDTGFKNMNCIKSRVIFKNFVLNLIMSPHFLDLFFILNDHKRKLQHILLQQKSLKFLLRQSDQSEVLSDESILHSHVYIINKAFLVDFLTYLLLATCLVNDL